MNLSPVRGNYWAGGATPQAGPERGSADVPGTPAKIAAQSRVDKPATRPWVSLKTLNYSLPLWYLCSISIQNLIYGGEYMAGIEEYDFQNLSNMAEKIVLDELGRQLDEYKFDICKCNDCVVDMAAMALNSVKPLYRCSLLGELYTAAVVNDESYTKSVQKAVRLAIEKVSLNPGHV
jgi:competence protein ComFB